MGPLGLPFVCKLIKFLFLLPTALTYGTPPLVSSVQCPECKYPNDQNFSFCQRCGFNRLTLILPTQSMSVPVDLPSIDNRLASIRSQCKSLPYEKQKSSLQKQLEMFLGPLPSPKNLQSATPLDLARFLVWKDGKGKTKVHTSRCPLFGMHSKNH